MQDAPVPAGSSSLARQTLAGSEIERRGETAATAAAAQVRAQLEFAYAVAMRNPRDWEEVRLRILKECERPAFAREALYNKPIGEGVTGLSIRFAEKALMCMRNVSVDTIVTFDDDYKRIVRQVITDLESNVHVSKDVTINKTVERKTVKEGQEVLGSRMNSRNEIVHLVRATEDDLLNKEGALVSKAMRTNLLRILPGDIQAAAEEKISTVLATQDAKDPEGRKLAMLRDFYNIGVKPAQIADVLGVERMDDTVLSPAQLSQCRGLYNAIKDGETTIHAAIEHAREQRGEKTEGEKKAPASDASTASSTASRVANKIGAGKKKEKPPAEAPPAAAPPPAKDPTTAPPPAEAFDPKSTAAKLQNSLIDLAEGNIAEAELLLSEATAGKIQKFTALADALAARHDWAEMITLYIDRRSAS